MKKLKLYDAVGITIFGAIFLYLLSIIPINGDLINPISKMFSDFEQTDVVFSQMRENSDVDPNIVLVNIGRLDRAGIAKQIEIINRHKPKVIGIDAFFRNPKHSEDPYQDSILVAGDSALSLALSKVPNMVLGMELIEDTASLRIAEIKYSNSMFMHKNVQLGYLDMISEGKNTFRTARTCVLHQEISDSLAKAYSMPTDVMSFPTRMAHIFDPKAYEDVRKRANETEVINYIGNVQAATSDGTPNSKIVFSALDVDNIFMADEDPEADALLDDVIKDKIIIMGFMGPDLLTYDKEDRFFTPLNKNYVGRADEDMYGVVVHANICSMLIQRTYIDNLPPSIDLLINLVIIFLNILLFMFLYFKLELFWDGATLLITIFQGILLTLVVLHVFNDYDIILNFNLSLLALFLMPNIIELYYGLIKTSELKLRNKFSTLKVKKSGINLNK